MALTPHKRVLAVFGVTVLLCGAAARPVLNRGVDAYPMEIEHPETEIPPDADEKTEWAFARLRYPSIGSFSFGMSRHSWGVDSPKADRQFSLGMRRLTRVHTRSIEEVVNLEGDQVFNWPWLYAVEVGHWQLTDAQAAKLREYLLRGGFLMTDDFHGTQEWAVFMASLQRIFPDRPVVDIPNDDAIFHVLYDLDQRIQVPGIQYWYTGRIWEKDGVEPHWRGVFDDKGRIMVAACHNQDNGDAWEWADHPNYPERYASQAYRMGVNYVIYAMTH
jgi:hypothetical protein